MNKWASKLVIRSDNWAFQSCVLSYMAYENASEFSGDMQTS